MSQNLKLYSYYRSTAAYRVRIALNLKQLAHEIIPVHLVKDGGEQHQPDYTKLNPQHLVPTLVDGDTVITQSLAILEYLDEQYPQTKILPADIKQRAYVRAIAQTIACEIHPLNNLRVLQYLKHELKLDDATKTTWYHHWLRLNFDALETMLNQSNYQGEFCCGNQPTLADICLIPQLYNANRFEFSLKPYPTLGRINANALALEPFSLASPEKQADNPE